MKGDLTEQELEVLEKLFETSTPAPWRLCEGDKTIDVVGKTKFYGDKEFIFVDSDDCDQHESYANAGFVVHARVALPRAVAEIRRLREEVKSTPKGGAPGPEQKQIEDLQYLVTQLTEERDAWRTRALNQENCEHYVEMPPDAGL